MFRKISIITIQSRGIKHQVDVKWVKPPYVPAYKPERSGDLEPSPPIPDSSLGKIYALCDEIKDAPESVKKIFSVAHLGHREHNVLVKAHLIDRVKRHQYDNSSIETRIATITGFIRYLQETMEKYPRNVKAKKTVQELIDKRRKLLKCLREYDYKKFEWLLEQLNIVYKPAPQTNHKLSRKESLRKLTEMHCDDIRNKKLADYRNLLQSQQGPFLKQKIEALKFIRSEQQELQLEITVTEQDIKKVEKQLDEWTIKENIRQQANKKIRNIIADAE